MNQEPRRPRRRDIARARNHLARTADQDGQIAQLRAQGLTWDEIGAQVGLAGETARRRWLTRSALAARPDVVAQVAAVEHERLSVLADLATARALDDSLPDVDRARWAGRAITASESLRRLHGLDKPRQLDVAVMRASDLTPAEREHRLRALLRFAESQSGTVVDVAPVEHRELPGSSSGPAALSQVSDALESGRSPVDVERCEVGA